MYVIMISHSNRHRFKVSESIVCLKRDTSYESADQGKQGGLLQVIPPIENGLLCITFKLDRLAEEDQPMGLFVGAFQVDSPDR
mgnify:CR=1 FL=1